MLTFIDFIDRITDIITKEYDADPNKTLKLIFSKIVKNKIKSSENRNYVFAAWLDDSKTGTGKYLFNYSDLELKKLLKDQKDKELTSFKDVPLAIFLHLPAICDYLEREESLKLECSLERFLVFYYETTKSIKCA